MLKWSHWNIILIFFVPLFSFYPPWLYRLYLWFSVFRGYRTRPMAWNGLAPVPARILTANFYFLIGWCEPNRIEIKLYVIGQRVETTDLSYRRMKQYWLSLHINPLVTSAIHQNFITDYSIFWLNQNLEFSFWGYSQGKWTLK